VPVRPEACAPLFLDGAARGRADSHDRRFRRAGLDDSEQVWDGPDIPSLGLQFGRPNGFRNAARLAHAEYLELLVTIALAGFPDIVMPARRRYTEGPAHEPAFVCRIATRSPD